MKSLYTEKLSVVSECDYRYVENRAACGCNQANVRCLLGLGPNPRDVNEVSLSDCLLCTKNGGKANGRVMDADPQIAAGDDGAKDHHLRVTGAGSRRSNSRCGALVPVTRPWVLREPVAESGVEREVLRLERSLARLWFDVRNMVNFRGHPFGPRFGVSG